MNRPYQGFMACESSFDDAQMVLFGAPFDGTVSYRPGTRFGPMAIRNESFGIETYSPYLAKDLEDYRVFDGGDLDLPFGNPQKAVDGIYHMAKEILSKGKIPFMLGGEHLVTLGAVKAACEKFSDLHIIHFDAHADLRYNYMEEKLSHACVIRRCHELVGDGRIFQFGIRSMTRDEDDFAKSHVVQRKFDTEGLEQVIKKIGDKPVYITIDMDVLDPSVFPGTGTPEPGGITYNQLLQAVHSFQALKNVVALDINELSPHYDPSGVSTACACKLVRELVLTIL